MRTMLAVAVVGALAAVDGCDPGSPMVCVDMACLDELRIELDEPLAEAGAYRVELVADGESTTCELRLPYGDDHACSGPDQPVIAAKTPHGGHTIGVVLLHQRAPRAVSLRVLHEGAVVVEEALEPRYVKKDVNGDECPGSCREATVVVTVPAGD